MSVPPSPVSIGPHFWGSITGDPSIPHSGVRSAGDSIYDKSLTGEPILPSRTANQYLARYWFAVRDGKIGSPVRDWFAVRDGKIGSPVRDLSLFAQIPITIQFVIRTNSRYELLYLSECK